VIGITQAPHTCPVRNGRSISAEIMLHRRKLSTLLTALSSAGYKLPASFGRFRAGGDRAALDISSQYDRPQRRHRKGRLRCT